VAVGASVTKFAVGDIAGVGCFTDSCRTCEFCKEGEEQYCSGPGGMHGTYGSNRAEELHPGGYSMGGYSSDIVVDENYTIKVPSKLNVAAAAPLLCAGITCFSPFKNFGVTKGMKVGIAGLGGLGHMGVKIAAAMGAEVTVFTRQESKRATALEMGATNVVVTGDADQLKSAAQSCDFIYNSISAPHDIVMYLNLLKNRGTMCVVGAPPDPFTTLRSGTLLGRGLNLQGSLIGGIRQTQEMIDFCAEHDILCEIELIPAEAGAVDVAWDRTLKADVKYRFVIDTAATMVCGEAKE